MGILEIALRVSVRRRAALGVLSFASVAHAEPGAPGVLPRGGTGAASVAELAAGACRLGRWTAALDLLAVLPPSERSTADWLCQARAQAHLGDWVAALDSYDELGERAGSSAAQPIAVQLAEAERRDLEARLAWVQIVPAAPLPAQARVTLDGQPIHRSRLGVPFPAQPGRRRLELEVQGHVRRVQLLRFEEGERRVITLDVPLDATLGAGPENTTASSVPPAVEREDPYAPWSRAAFYAGGIGTGAGIVLLVAAAIERSPGAGLAGASSLGFAGLGVMTGAALRLLGKLDQEEAPLPGPRPTRIEPWLGAHGAGVSGSF